MSADNQNQMNIQKTDRRKFLARMSLSAVPLALAYADHQQLLAKPVKPDLEVQRFNLESRQPSQAGQAKAMISMFMQGGPSQVDLMDPKPILNEMHLQKFPGKIKYDNAAQASSRILGSPWKFKQHGQSGTALSELLPGLAACNPG